MAAAAALCIANTSIIHSHTHTHIHFHTYPVVNTKPFCWQCLLLIHALMSLPRHFDGLPRFYVKHNI